MAADEAFMIGLGMGVIVGLVAGLGLAMWWLQWVFFGGEKGE